MEQGQLVSNQSSSSSSSRGTYTEVWDGVGAMHSYPNEREGSGRLLVVYISLPQSTYHPDVAVGHQQVGKLWQVKKPRCTTQKRHNELTIFGD
jgi:hypothetical protein